MPSGVEIMTRKRTRSKMMTNNKESTSERDGIERTPSMAHAEHESVVEIRPFIKEFYRINHDWKDALYSLFAFHNETLNVYTHLIPMLLLSWQFVRILTDETWQGGEWDRYKLLMYIGSAMFMTLSSSAYHLLSCISPYWARTLLRIDMVGIAQLIFSSFVVGLDSGFRCEPNWYYVHGAVISLLLGTATFMILFVHDRSYDWPKILILCAGTAYGAIPAFQWVFTSDPELLEESLGPLAGMLLGYFVGFLVFVSRFPERWYPGATTSVISSHAIWHLAVAFAAWTWFAGSEDIRRHVMPKAQCVSLLPKDFNPEKYLPAGPGVVLSVEDMREIAETRTDRFGFTLTVASTVVSGVRHLLKL